ncbi:hypothetical protein P4O66_000891 [Electrophorus voltai]|uniref:Reverse transcriptase/retrotransposon-derived protein RNase H-like domain-containing protein n=1 Tax=Electrophorus voltai TaxID=2609070 RepID=A0AAD8ZED6_9TELE|nr:hypothetical protein P4O66_000891 [Electrophorus voltai]
MEAFDRYVFIYLDNILMYSQTVDEQVTHARRILQLLLENYLFVKLEKQVFKELKRHLIMAPILWLPDAELPLIVEVGVGAVLSQRLGGDKLHPCAYFSWCLSPAEQNYNVGDRELLAVKLTLEDWRHWLEGANTPS